MQQSIEVVREGIGPGAGRVELFHSHILKLSNMDTKPASQ
jgi:hypothetical protein